MNIIIHLICKKNDTDQITNYTTRSDQISRSVVSDSLRPHELQHGRPPCPSPTPGVHSDSRPSSQWCHSAISSSVVPFSSYPQSLPASDFSNESTLRMRWPKYWSFSFSIIPSKEIPGLISFRMGWLDLLAVQHHNSVNWPCCVLVAQSCPTLCNPMDCSLLGSSVHGVLQARILGWVAIPFSRGSSRSGIEPQSPALQIDSLLPEPSRKPINWLYTPKQN